MATILYSLTFAVFVTLSQSQPQQAKVCENYDQCDEYGISGTSVTCSAESSCNYECFTFSGGHYVPCDFPPSISSTNIKSGDIICSGESSCYDVDEIDSKKDLICSGYRSCYIAQYSLSRGYTQDLSARLNINCDGSESCTKGGSTNQLRKTMISGKKQYCSGYSSCKGHTDTDVDPISSGFHNLLIKPANRAACYGADACAKATVEAGLSTLCMGAASCCRTDITTSQATVCAGYRSCQQSEINTDGGRVDSYVPICSGINY